MNDNGVIEYDMFPDGPGWTVRNVKTGEAALWKGVRQIQLALNEAENLLGLLKALEMIEPGSSVRWGDGSR